MDVSPAPVTREPRQPPARRSAASAVALVVFALLTGLGIIGAVVVVGGYVSLTRNLEPVGAFDDITFAEETVVYDRSGQTELARFGEFRRDVATFEELPPILLDATTAVEDKTFWTNPGFDPAAIIASGIDAVRGRARGASTITQQLVRQRLLEPDLVQAKGRTAERKLKEIIQSVRLTQEFGDDEAGKQKIITAYLNQNFYGNNSYGVKAAAQGYFGKPLDELTLSEAALLAALPQSPSSYDLVRNAVQQDDGTLLVPDDTDIVQRRNLVLDLMADGRTPRSGSQYDAADFEAAKEEPVVLAPQQPEPWTAAHFVWRVRDELTRVICGDEAQTCDELEHGGFRITSTLDIDLQRSAQKWVKAAAIVPKARNMEQAAERIGFDDVPDWVADLRDKDVNNGALVALDYETGQIVAYVGSADYELKATSSKFQPKYDVVGQGWRQPGSAFKPFNYLTGIDDGSMTAATMFMDVGTDFGGGYTPTNADNLERGPVRVRNALQFSLNIPSVKAMAVNQPEHVYARAQEFGMRFRSETTDAGLALALGVAEVRPIDLVTAYGTLANQGRYVPHTTILRIQDQAGKDLIDPNARPEGTPTAKPEAAAIVTDILAGNTNPDVNPYWGAFAIRDGDQRRPATLKTGTNNDARDLNAYGFIAPPTADGRAAGEYALAVGAWNGNSDNTIVSTPDKPVFSIDVTTYVWQGFLQEVSQGWAINDFTLPAGVVAADVDPWTGLKPAPGGPAVRELFYGDSAPKQAVGTGGGVCGEDVLRSAGFESRFEAWMRADQDWIARARRGPGVPGGPEGMKTSYFYDGRYVPYGRSWGPLLGAGSCASPEPSPTCFPLPTPGPDGSVPSFVAPTPSGSGPAPEPCPTEPPTPSPSASPSEEPTPQPSPPPTPEPTPEPTPAATPKPTPDKGPPSQSAEPSGAGGDTGGGTPSESPG